MPLFGIRGTELKKMIALTKAVLKSVSLPSNLRTGNAIPPADGLLTICPRCDAYALGSEMSKGAELQAKDGKQMNFREIEISLWG